MLPLVDKNSSRLLDHAGAFVPHGRFEIEPNSTGMLSGLTFAAKDLFDITGHVAGAGNPRWLETHLPAAATAPAVASLLGAGARMVGKTVTDEVAYSLNGDNIHYGTPRNPKAPGRVPGGSSSGSAAAVAASLCDFALGTDTGGSVRIPASYCGILGIRTTHGAISTEGVVPLMPSFDTVGWFARDAQTLARVGEVLLPPNLRSTHARPTKLLVAADCFALLDAELDVQVRALIRKVASQFETVAETEVSGVRGLEAWRHVFRVGSAHETWKIHGPWVTANGYSLATPIRERFEFAACVTDEEARHARTLRSEICRELGTLVDDETVVILPTAPGPAPLLSSRGEEVENFRQSAQRLTAVAGLAGLPQVSVPLLEQQGAPLGISLMGAAGSDGQLLELAKRLYPLPVD